MTNSISHHQWFQLFSNICQKYHTGMCFGSDSLELHDLCKGHMWMYVFIWNNFSSKTIYQMNTLLTFVKKWSYDVHECSLIFHGKLMTNLRSVAYYYPDVAVYINQSTTYEKVQSKNPYRDPILKQAALFRWQRHCDDWCETMCAWRDIPHTGSWCHRNNHKTFRLIN